MKTITHAAEVGGPSIGEPRSAGEAEADLWKFAPADDYQLSPADRKLWRREERQPDFWKYLTAPQRATVCTEAALCYHEEPTLNNFALGGRLGERLDRRMEHSTPAERQRLHAIRVIMGQQLATIADLGWRLVALRGYQTEARKQIAQLTGALARFGGQS